MLTPPPPAPASLPPPRRRPLRRLNRVLGIIFCGIVLIIAAAIGYSIYQRGTGQMRLLAQPSPSGADNPFKDKNPGWVPPERKYHPEKIPVSTEPLPAQKKEEPKAAPAEADDDGVEKARKQAWTDHWKDVEKVRQDHFDKRKDALANLNTAQPTSSGEKGETKTSAAAPASPTGHPGGSNAGGWSGGLTPAAWGGGGGFGGFPGYGGGFGDLPPAQIDRESQEQKIAFANQKGDIGKDDVVPTVHKPYVPNTVMAGDYINMIAENQINSDVPGSALGRVTESVYDHTGHCVLIPATSKIIGKYNSVVGTGQTRLPGVMNRIIFPDGSSQAIGAMEAADNAGSAGWEDQVDRHLLLKFGSAALTGLFGAGIYLAIPNNNNNNNNGYSAEQIIGVSLAQQIGQTGQQITRQNLSVPNTLVIRAGYRYTIIMDKDVHMEPWECDGQARHGRLPIMSVND